MPDEADKIQIRRRLKDVYLDRSKVCFIDSARRLSEEISPPWRSRQGAPGR